MSHQAVLFAFATLWLLEFAAFGMQRATLLLSREANTSPKATAMLLPAWFPAVWLVRIAKWLLLLYLAIAWSFWVALALVVVDFVLSAVVPIPYRLFLPTFRRRVAQLKDSHPELGTALEALLQASEMNTS